MLRKVLIIIAALTSILIAFSQNKPKTNIQNAPIYTLFSPMTLVKNSFTSGTVPLLTKATTGNTLTLTDGKGCEGTAATFNNKFGYSKDWKLSFIYSASGGGILADGIAVSIHNDALGIMAVGASGSGLGCVTPNTNNFCGDYSPISQPPIKNSVNLLFDILHSQVRITTVNNSGVQAVYASGFFSYSLILSGVPVQIDIRYESSTNKLTYSMNNGMATFTKYNTINLSTYIGGSTAYLTLTGGTGANYSTQKITKLWMMANI